MRLDDSFEQIEGIAQEIRRTVHRGLKLLHGLDPLAFFLERLKPAMLLLQDGLFGVEHQTIGRIHAVPLLCDGRRYQRNHADRNNTKVVTARSVGLYRNAV